MNPRTKKILKRTMIIALSIIFVIVITTVVFINQANFGHTPTGERKQRVEHSPNYKDGKFQNLSYTPQLTGDKNMIQTLYDFLFVKHNRVKPKDKIPSVKTDLLHLDKSQDIFVWFGHSSYLMQVGGKRFLVDPVLDGAASPVTFINKPFAGADIYKSEDIPEVDYLVISHDHWDHLDYSTVMKLKERIGKVICSLGVGEHFERWGFDPANIIELDWNESANLGDGSTVYCLPARHFSGRGLSPNQSIWASYLIQTPDMKVYIGGDSGYDTHFAKIGEQFGNIDIAILENGQYDAGWKYIHMMPEEVVQAGKDLHADRVIPVHSSKFALSVHEWDQPLKRIAAAAKTEGLPILTPMIGEVVDLNDSTQVFNEWWVGIE